jgi:lysozyme family protein
MTFDEAFEILLGHEGGFVDHPRDPGGATKWGITKRDHPGEDIRNLTKERAKIIYRHGYWAPAGCDAAPDALKFDLFDSAVNQGVTTAVKFLQAAVGETTDGILGPRTLQAINSMPPLRVLCRFNAVRLNHYAGLHTFPTFGRGWVRRVAANLARS